MYPVADKELCIECHLCEKVCAANNNIDEKKIVGTYAAFNKSEDDRLASSSGGVFRLLAKKTLNAGGMVFGAAFNSKWEVEHIGIDSISDLPRLQKSKYVQSNTNGIFGKVKKEAESGRSVLFTGTPCQCNALSLFLAKEYDNLIIADVVCHGAPSPLAWNKYLRSISDSDVKNVDFRDKKNGWKNYCVSIISDGNEDSASFWQNSYMKLFLGDLILRPSCYQCNSKFQNKSSDLTLGDLWGAEQIAPDMDDDKGLSLVIVNSKKGEAALREISQQLEIKAIDREEAFAHNPNIRSSCAKPANRDKVMKTIREKNDIDFDKLATKATKKSLITRAVHKAKRAAKKMINRLIELWKKSKTLALISKHEDRKFRKRLKNKGFTVLTPNCMAGLIYHRLGEPFNSPTINISMETNDFCEFLDNMDFYIAQDVYEYCANNPQVDYPVGIIKGNCENIPDIRINFVHYKTFEDGRAKWNERKKRIKRENTYVILCDVDDIYERDCNKAGFASDEALRKFESFQCNNKVLLTRDPNRQLEYAVYIEPKYGKPFPITYLNKNVFGLDRFEQKFDYVGFLNKK